MRTIVHLSDVHFGRIDEALVEPLIEQIKAVSPQLVAISGDLTQRARRSQFLAARRFLDRLPSPLLVIPGNHDLPLYNLLARFLFPLASYRRYITRDLSPVYRDSEMVVAGVNTTRRFTRKDGRINARQVGELEKHFLDSGPDQLKVVVSHHPFDIPEGHASRDLLGRADMAMRVLAKSGADLFLAGHLHISRTSRSTERYKIAGHSALIVQAGTVSQRARGETNAFNVLRLESRRIEVHRYEWASNTRGFRISSKEPFERDANGWNPALSSASYLS